VECEGRSTAPLHSRAVRGDELNRRSSIIHADLKQIVARIWEFLGSPSFEELKGRVNVLLHFWSYSHLVALNNLCPLRHKGNGCRR
jgi:hypothetical protein